MLRTPKLATGLRKPRAFREYKDAVVEHRLLTSYQKSANKILPKAEYELLSEFVRISKRKCQRLRKALDQKSSKQSSAA
jgi:hypothetical protein